jgi:FkbM family methyltransferase
MLRGLESWSLRWTYVRFVVESRLGIPYRGLLAPAATESLVTRRGYRFQPRDGTADRDLLGPFHEVQTQWFLRRWLARAAPGGVFIDVGAHCGSICVPLESFFDAVIAIEPLPENFGALKRNIELNTLDGKVTAVNVAAGAERGMGTLYIDNDDTASLIPKRTSRSLEVEMRSLDDLLMELGTPSSSVRFLKVDVEGAELAVLAGARRLLQDASPLVLLEGNTAAARQMLVERMQSIRYPLVRVADGSNLIFARTGSDLP